MNEVKITGLEAKADNLASNLHGDLALINRSLLKVLVDNMEESPLPDVQRRIAARVAGIERKDDLIQVLEEELSLLTICGILSKPQAQKQQASPDPEGRLGFR